MGFTSNLTPKLYPHFTKLFDQAMGKLGYRSSAVDALQGADLTGRVAVVTGKSSQVLRPIQPPCITVRAAPVAAAGRRSAQAS
jgi:hypothetical protein